MLWRKQNSITCNEILERFRKMTHHHLLGERKMMKRPFYLFSFLLFLFHEFSLIFFSDWIIFFKILRIKRDGVESLMTCLNWRNLRQTGGLQNHFFFFFFFFSSFLYFLIVQWFFSLNLFSLGFSGMAKESLYQSVDKFISDKMKVI